MTFAALLFVSVVAGRYGEPNDRWDNGSLACPVRPSDAVMGLAHRTKPCGARVIVCARRCAVARVVDRGPYLTRSGKLARKPTEEPYRGEVDLRPALARAIGWRDRVWIRWMDDGKGDS